jgi:hypothetical protein
MMASLLVFSVVTIGVVPLLASSIQGAGLARNLTLGKAMGQEAMERARGLPYYKAIDDQRTNADGSKTREDLLDMVYPCASTDSAACPGYSATARNVAPLGDLPAHTYLTTCTSTSSDPACATQIDDEYTIYYVAEFKAAAGTTSETVIPTSTPGSNYAWDISGRDSPPSQLLNLSITVASQVGADIKTYKLESLLGDRKFGDILISGSASVDYGIQVETSFVEPLTGFISTLTAIGGTARSSIEQRLISSASQDVTAGELRLVRQPTSSNPVPENLDDTPKRGASVVGLSAPPASTPGAVTVGPQTATHPTLSILGEPEQVASFLDTQAGHNVPTDLNALSVSVADELPLANGGFDFSALGDNNNGFFWVQNQADTGSNTLLKIDSNRKLLALRRDTGSSRTLYGRTNATTGTLGTAERRVELSGQVTIEEFRIFPVTFIPGANPRRSVIFIEDFTASVDCNSAPTTGTAAGSWSANLLIWRDPFNDGTTSLSDPITGESPGHISIPIGTLADGTFESRDLRTILAGAPYNILGGNPLIYDDIINLNDVYLFKEPLKNGYLDEAGFTMKAPSTSTGGGGTSTAADVDQAIGITTVPTSLTLPESGLRISIGKLRCDALDAR